MEAKNKRVRTRHADIEENFESEIETKPVQLTNQVSKGWHEEASRRSLANREVGTMSNLGSAKMGPCQDCGQRSREPDWRPHISQGSPGEVPMASYSVMAVATRQRKLRPKSRRWILDTGTSVPSAKGSSITVLLGSKYI